MALTNGLSAWGAGGGVQCVPLHHGIDTLLGMQWGQRRLSVMPASSSQASWAMRFNLLHGTNAAAAGGFHTGKRLAPSTNTRACYCFNFHILQLGRPSVIILPRQKSLSGSLLLEIMQKIGGMLTECSVAPCSAREMPASSTRAPSPVVPSLFSKNWTSLSGRIYATCNLTEILL